jgi:D-serine dehydratase
MRDQLIEQLKRRERVLWENTAYDPRAETDGRILSGAEAFYSEMRPLVRRIFPETEGWIRSPLVPLERMGKELHLKGRLLLKRDGDLPIAGSIKARGGIYEVLSRVVAWGQESPLYDPEENTAQFADPRFRAYFSSFKIQVGSTGNLGLSIGTLAAAFGFRAIVHMSADAKPWKVERLREKGVDVRLYEGDYSEAVSEGRRLSEADPKSYFVDDESSELLFAGYTLAGPEVVDQLEALGVAINADTPLYVYLPCGVGGGPGGVAYGLKTRYGPHVHPVFIEPTESPCMLLGLYTGEHEHISVSEIGLTNRTVADGLAVGRPSGLVSRRVGPMIQYLATAREEDFSYYQQWLYNAEGIYIEPSSAAGFVPLKALDRPGAIHLVWGTGGGLVPISVRRSEGCV